MTEAEWLAYADPDKMLDFWATRTSHRKLRLFACACARRVLYWITDQNCQKALDVAERYADFLASDVELAAAEALVRDSEWEAFGAGFCVNDPTAVEWKIRQAVGYAVGPEFNEWRASKLAAEGWVSVVDVIQEKRHEATNRALAGHAALLRCIAGNPFRPVTSEPTWRTDAATTLSRTIYDERRWELLPLLADLLEEVGCSAEVSEHCRGPGPHARGCWVVDLVLGLS